MSSNFNIDNYHFVFYHIHFSQYNHDYVDFDQFDYDQFDHVRFNHNQFDNDNNPCLCINFYLDYLEHFENLILSATIKNYQRDQINFLGFALTIPTNVRKQV